MPPAPDLPGAGTPGLRGGGGERPEHLGSAVGSRHPSPHPLPPQSSGKPPRREDAEPFSTRGSLGSLTASREGPERGQPLARPGRRAELRAGTQHPTALGQLLLSNANRATTRTSEADGVAARREGAGGEPGVPTQPGRLAGAAALLCLGKAPRDRAPRQGKAGMRACGSKVSSRSAIAGGVGGSWRGAPHPGVAEETSLPALLLPRAQRASRPSAPLAFLPFRPQTCPRLRHALLPVPGLLRKPPA